MSEAELNEEQSSEDGVEARQDDGEDFSKVVNNNDDDILQTEVNVSEKYVDKNELVEGTMHTEKSDEDEEEDNQVIVGVEGNKEYTSKYVNKYASDVVVSLSKVM